MSELHRIMQQRPRGHPYPFGAAARADVDSEEYVELCRLAKQLQKAVPAFAPGGKPPTVYIDDPEAEKALRAAFEEDVPELLEAPALTEVLRILHSAKTLKVAVEAPDAVETAEALEVTGAPKAVERPEAPETADVLEVPKAVETAEAVEATGVPKAIETADAVETTSANSEPTWDAGVPWEIFELIVSNLAEQHDLLRCVCMDRQCTVCRERDLITDTFVFLHQTCRYLRRDPSHWQRCYESTLAQIVADCDYRVILQQLCRFRYRRRMWREKNIMDYLERQFPDYNAFLLHICQDTHTFQCLDRKRINRLASYFVKGLMYLQFLWEKIGISGTNFPCTIKTDYISKRDDATYRVDNYNYYRSKEEWPLPCKEPVIIIEFLLRTTTPFDLTPHRDMMAQFPLPAKPPQSRRGTIPKPGHPAERERGWVKKMWVTEEPCLLRIGFTFKMLSFDPSEYLFNMLIMASYFKMFEDSACQ